MTEQNEQGLGENSVQNLKPSAKPRSAEAKRGRIKYTLDVLHEVLAEVRLLQGDVRVIRNALGNAGFMRFTVPVVQKFAFVDKVDEEIFELVRTKGSFGMFPKDVATELGQYDLAYYDVSRRIVRMNKRLKEETGKVLFEKRGHRWALTRFAFDVYGATEEEVAQGNSSNVESAEGL